MLSISVYDNIIFDEQNAHAEALFVDRGGRVLRFALKPGQMIGEHNAPSSPMYILIMQGSGIFSGGDQKAQRFGRGMMLAFDVGETHAILAEDEELVFLAFLHGVPEELKSISPELE